MNAFDKEYGFDEKIANGNWFLIRGIRVKLAYMQSTKISGKVDSLRSIKKEQVGRELNENEHADIGSKVFCNQILLDWKMEGYPCTPENIAETIEKYPLFLQECMQVANNNKRFQDEVVKDTVKKL